MQPTDRFKVLDAWRGICALIVASYHYPARFAMLDWPIFRAGWVFVDFFFVLSGFVICHRYLGQGRRLDLSDFCVRRLHRLLPTHAITLLVVVATSVGIAGGRFVVEGGIRLDGVGSDATDFCRMLGLHMLLLQGFSGFGAVGLNVPSWSVSVEFWTNVLFGVLARLGILDRRTLLLVAALTGTVLSLQAPATYLDGAALSNAARAMFGFTLGALAYDAFKSARLAVRISTFCCTLAELACLGALATAAHAARHMVCLWTLPLLFSACILVFAGERGMISRLLLTAPFQRAGARSYAIYLLHFSILSLFYAGGTAITRVPELARISALIPASLAAPTAYLLYLAAVWAGSRILSDRIARASAQRALRRASNVEQAA